MAEAGREALARVVDDVTEGGARVGEEVSEGASRGAAGRELTGTTEHAAGRQAEARAGDATRQVGDPNRVVRESRAYTDTATGYDVYVNGNRVVIVNPKTGEQVTQFVNTRANTSSRVASGKWVVK